MTPVRRKPNLPKVRNLREGQTVRKPREVHSEEGEVEVELVDLDPTQRGYHVAWNYGTRYWLPLLGPLPWAVWQTLLSFCFGERDTCWPSISLIADIAAGGNRKAIAGRWRGKGDKRRRQPGALEILQQAGLLSIGNTYCGSQTRYRFRVLKDPPLLAPHQLARLSPRLQEDHAELLARCGLDERSYPQLIHSLRGGGAQGTLVEALGPTPGAQDTTSGAQGPTNKYKEERQIEELWRRIKEALKLEISEPNYDHYIADTRGVFFDRDTGLLVVETPSHPAAAQLNRYWAPTIGRAVAMVGGEVEGVPIVVVEFVPRREQVWEACQGT